MPLLTNIASLARCLPQGPQAEIHVVRGAALAWEDGTILWAGAESELPARFRGGPKEDAGGRLGVPGLGDCHTHLAFAVATVEAKSGYGLTEEHELRLLEIYRELTGGPQRLVATLLAAHAVPPEYQACRADYVELVVERIIPRAAREGLARFCDVFVEESAFTVAEGRRILDAGQRHGLRARLHADQSSSCGGAELAAL